MATNPFLEEARRRDALVGQIPTGGQRQAPAADGSQGNILNNDLGRNLAALPSVVNIPGAVLRGTGLVARAFGAAQPAMSGVGQAAQAAAPYAPWWLLVPHWPVPRMPTPRAPRRRPWPGLCRPWCRPHW